MTEYRAPIRFSGLRIPMSAQSAEAQRDLWQARLNDIQWLLPALQDALAEPFFADDYIVDLPFDALVQSAMQGGELFGCVHEEKIVGFVLLRDIKPGRDAWIEAYTVPEFRGKYPCSKQIRQILDYAFRPWNPELTKSQQLSPRGLGLQKIKAAVSSENINAQAALWRLGFFTVGRSPRDGLFKGRYTDIILVEKINPIYLPKQEPQNVRKERQSANTPQPDTSSSVPVGTGLSSVGPSEEPIQRLRAPSGDGGDSDAKRPRKRRIAGLEQLRLGLVEPETKPNRRRKRGESDELLQEAPSARHRADGVKHGRKRTGRK